MTEELKNRGAAIIEYLHRNGVNVSGPWTVIYEDVLSDLSKIGMGEYKNPLVTPYELYKICSRARQSAKRGRKVYQAGGLNFSVIDGNGDTKALKTQQVIKIVFHDINLTIVRKGGSSEKPLRWVWEKHDDESAMLFVIANKKALDEITLKVRRAK